MEQLLHGFSGLRNGMITHLGVQIQSHEHCRATLDLKLASMLYHLLFNTERRSNSAIFITNHEVVHGARFSRNTKHIRHEEDINLRSLYQATTIPFIYSVRPLGRHSNSSFHTALGSFQLKKKKKKYPLTACANKWGKGPSSLTMREVSASAIPPLAGTAKLPITNLQVAERIGN
jgi:hypothetical protein